MPLMRLYRGKSGQTCHPIPAGRPGLFPPAGQQSRRLRGMYSRSCACGGTDAGGARLCDGVSYPPDRSDRLSGNHRKTVRKAGRDGFHSRRGAAFVEKNSFPLIKRFPFTLAGARYDRKAKRQAKEYRFLFVRADGVQLEKITRIVEAEHIIPQIDPHEFDFSQINDALNLVAGGHINGKVMVRFPE